MKQVSEDMAGSGRLDELPVSFGQEELWFLNLIEGTSSALHISWLEKLEGELDVEALKNALQYILDRHESLRVVFKEKDGACRAIINKNLSLPFRLVECEQPDQEVLEGIISQFKQDMQKGFDLEDGPLWQVTLYRLDDNNFYILYHFHHIISDGLSIVVFLKELAYCYQIFVSGGRPLIPPLEISYSQFAQRQRSLLDESRMESLMDYWNNALKDYNEMLKLPYDVKGSGQDSYEAGYVDFAISEELAGKLRDLSKAEGVTLYVTLLTIYQMFLVRLCGQQDMVVCSPLVGRTRLDELPLIGYFINILPLRLKLTGDPDFRTCLHQVGEAVINVMEHQDLPVQKLVKQLAPQRNSPVPSLFQAVFQLRQEDIDGIELGGIKHDYIELPVAGTFYDVYMDMHDSKSGIQGRLVYKTTRFTRENAASMVGQFVELSEELVSHPDTRLGDMGLDVSRRVEPVTGWTDTEKEIPALNVADLFRIQAEKTPAAVALISRNTRLNYGELHTYSNQLAHYLVEQDVRAGDVIAIAMERSPELVMGILGILKAGCAYVPLDPNLPVGRMSFILNDSGAKLILSSKQFIEDRAAIDCRIIDLDITGGKIRSCDDSNPVVERNTDDPAYIMYTSGSSGNPKGVVVPHRGIIRLLFNTDYVHLDDKQVFLHLAPIGFDAATFELWGPLLHGGQCVLFKNRVPTFKQLDRVLKATNVTTLFLTTAYFNTLIDGAPEILRGVRQLLFGGELVSLTHVQRAWDALPYTQLIHCYGPTEATTFSCCFHIKERPALDAGTVPIGKPIANTTIYLLDSMAGTVDDGETGEIYIGGPGVALGYINQPELTAEKFIPDPFSADENSRLYRTGDFARSLPDGNIEFVSRQDNQIKIRGFRIEPEEIEAALQRHPGVKKCVAFARHDNRGRKQLVACVTYQEPDAEERPRLRQFLADCLPSHMVPDIIAPIRVFPLTTSNKIDREKLQAADLQAYRENKGYKPPRDTTDSMVVEIWEEILDAHPIGIDDDFFDMGGDSLLVVSMVSRLEKQFGKTLPVSVLFANATIRNIVSALFNRKSAEANAPVIEVQKGSSERIFFFLHGDFTGGGFYTRKLAQLTGAGQSFCIMHPHGLKAGDMFPTIELMAADLLKELRVMQPHGPYLLGGHCNGALVAIEMARQLMNENEKVDLLVLIDPALISGTKAAEIIQPKLLEESEDTPSQLEEADDVIASDNDGLRKQLMKSYMKACASYSPAPYPGTLTIIARGKARGIRGSVKRIWEPLATEVDIKPVVSEGERHSVILGPDLEKVALELQLCLAKFT